MKLKSIYELIVKAGIATDPRSPKAIEDHLKKTKARYDSLSARDKTFFDTESLKNPYADTRILAGSGESEIKTVLTGIDMDISELLLIEQLNEKNKAKIDLAFSHHPQGSAYAHFYEVMDMQADIFHDIGVPINVAENLIEDRKNEVDRRIHAANHQRTIDAAKMLKIPFLCAHTPADNHAVRYLNNLLDHKKPQTLEQVMDLLLNIEEYKISSREQNPPRILYGRPQNRTGKILVDMTGGTEPPKDMVDNLLLAGIGTIVGMHFSEDLYKKLQGKNIHVVVAGHIASDNLGMNLLLDKIEKAAKTRILSCSGFRRIKR